MKPILALTMALTAANTVRAQVVATRALTTPQLELAQPFSQLAGIRELKTGQLIAVDARDFTVQLVPCA